MKLPRFKGSSVRTSAANASPSSGVRRICKTPSLSPGFLSTNEQPKRPSNHKAISTQQSRAAKRITKPKTCISAKGHRGYGATVLYHESKASVVLWSKPPWFPWLPLMQEMTGNACPSMPLQHQTTSVKMPVKLTKYLRWAQFSAITAPNGSNGSSTWKETLDAAICRMVRKGPTSGANDFILENWCGAYGFRMFQILCRTHHEHIAFRITCLALWVRRHNEPSCSKSPLGRNQKATIGFAGNRLGEKVVEDLFARLEGCSWAAAWFPNELGNPATVTVIA